MSSDTLFGFQNHAVPQFRVIYFARIFPERELVSM